MAHAREIELPGDAKFVEGGFGADAGQHEELRRLKDPRGEDDLFPGMQGEGFIVGGYFNPCGLELSVQVNLFRQGIMEDVH